MSTLDLSFLAGWDFISGIGDYAEKQVCAMSAAVAAVRISRGEDMDGATDHLDCVDPVIRRLIIARNDAMPDEGRREWALSMIPRFVGTNEGRAKTLARAEHIARYAVRVIAAEAMDSANLPELAARLRSVSYGASMADLMSVASEVRDTAAAYAYAYADTAAAYADAAAAYAAAAYAADADAAAYAYANDAAAAAVYVAQRTAVRLAHLDKMISDCLEM